MKNKIGGNQNRCKDFGLHLKICVGFDRILSQKVPLYIFRVEKIRNRKLQKKINSEIDPF